MPRFTKRINFDSIFITDLSEPSDSGSSLPPGEATASKSLPALTASFSFEKSTLPGYGTTLPATDIDFAFPAEDLARVQAWFSGDFSHVVNPESATLKKNMTAAVLSALADFISAASTRNLFSSPFKIGIRYRLFDNSYVYIAPPELLIPSESAPDLVITGFNVYEKSLHTEISVSQNPSALYFAISVPDNWEDYREIINSVEFFITRQADLYPSDAKVSGVRSISSDGIRQRTWHYERYDSDLVCAQARADSAFRLVASIPFSDISAGHYSEPSLFPMEAGTLQRLSSLPKINYSSDSASGGSSSGSSTSSSDNTPGISGWRPYIHIVTSALDLGLPERAKSISDLFLRGVFQREDVKLTLFGSHHREGWRMIARSSGPYIRGLRGVPYRWLKVEIELPMRRDDFLEALTFKFKI